MPDSITPRNLDQPLILSINPAGVGVVDVEQPSRPLPVLVGPLNLKPRDQIDLYWGAAPEPISRYEHPVNAPPINDFVTLEVETQRLESARDPVPVHYRFTPFPGGTAQDSAITRIRVRLQAPGGIDIDPATPHENEALHPPQVQPPAVIVDPRGVTVSVMPYPYMHEGDWIRVTWGEQTVDHPPLSTAQVDNTVVIPIPQEIIEAAGNATRLPVRYEIHDVVGNWSKRSPASEVVVSIG